MRIVRTATAVLLCALVLVTVAHPAAAPSPISYVGAATTVVKTEGQPPRIDDGIVICRSRGPSIGGGCLPFGASGAVAVMDDRLGLAVAFEVCIDNNGDGLCSGGRSAGPCGDQLFFSHDDQENFFNPLGPLPTSFLPGCGGGFPGYVVFLCHGIHFPKTGGAPHVHIPQKGTIAEAPTGTGFGDFCQGDLETPPKSYFLR